MEQSRVYKDPCTAQNEVFETLSKEVRFTVLPGGDIVFKNEEAKREIPEGTQFFSTLFDPDWKHSMKFFKRMYDTATICEETLIHSINKEQKRITYRGCYREGSYYLSGVVHPPEEEEQLSLVRSLLEQLECGVLWVTREGKLLLMNLRFQQLVFSQSTRVSPGRNLRQLHDESDVGRFVYEAVNEAERSNKTSVKVHEYAEEDTHLKTVATPMPLYEGIIVFLFDESSKIRYEQLLVYKQQMESVSQLSAGVAHELRNPLSVIKGFLQLSELTNSFHKYSNTIFSEIDRMNVIIENFLSISRKRFEPRLQNPMAVIESVEDIIRSECMLNDVRFTVDLTQTDRQINMNETMVKQVILNLLRNSMESYDPENGPKSFSLCTAVEGNDFIIRVSDNGRGIPEHILTKLGEPFTTTKTKGTGVGISLSKKIIEDHGGYFHIASEEYKGTSITISLPFAEG